MNGFDGENIRKSRQRRQKNDALFTGYTLFLFQTKTSVKYRLAKQDPVL